MKILVSVALICLYKASSAHDRVPPNVNPQHYGGNQFQQPPPAYQQQGQFGGQPPQQGQFQQPQGQFQQQQGQFQQPQGQFQQQQQQQGQFQQPQGQFQQQQPHGQHHFGQNPNVLDKNRMAQEKEHIKHHAKVPVDTSNMSEQELQFHYFKMHDADHNNKLDGSELIKSLIHWHDGNEHDGPETQPEPKIFNDDELATMIDPILAQDDLNRDGFIDYSEFVISQQNAAAAAAAKTGV